MVLLSGHEVAAWLLLATYPGVDLGSELDLGLVPLVLLVLDVVEVLAHFLLSRDLWSFWLRLLLWACGCGSGAGAEVQISEAGGKLGGRGC